MILMGWRRDRTLNYLFGELVKIGNPVHWLMLDDYFDGDRKGKDSSSETEIQHVGTFLDAHKGHGLYVRLLNPFHSSDERSAAVNRVVRYVDSLESLRVCNKVSAIPSNFSKFIHPRQYLRLLKAFNIGVPKSLLTNELSEDKIRTIFKADEVVVKGASSKKSICTPLDSEHFEKAKAHPCISLLQERIVGPDIRVHVTPFGYVAEGFVSTEIDYRFAKKKSAFQVELPVNIEMFCRQLIEVEGIVFAGIDFKLSSSGEWYFLEANSSPAFQGFDRRANGRIVKMLDTWDALLRASAHAMKPDHSSSTRRWSVSPISRMHRAYL